MTITLRGPVLAVDTCARRLGPLGVRPVRRLDAAIDGLGGVVLDGDDVPTLDVDLTWFGPADVDEWRGAEAVVQAMTGLMAVHGRDDGGPRRIGLEVASVAAGILGAQAVAAAMVGRRRGVAVGAVHGSVLQAGLLLNSHRIAAATAGPEWEPAPPGPAPGPPFLSADGFRFELETMDPVAWRDFWRDLGARDADLQWAWRLFRPRYFRGTCTLPAGLHEAASAHSLDRLEQTATAHHVSLRRVRTYDDVLGDPHLPAGGHPVISPLPGDASGDGGASGDDAAGPLAGLRVVEVTSRLQGPLPGLLLQHLGAQVVRVEPPVGDPTRSVPPLVDGVGSFFLSFNRGKEAVDLDLARPDGRGQLLDLVAGADVFLHNWRPGKAQEWGLDADDLTAVAPGLVYAHASGWGDDPAFAGLVGTDFLVQAHAGVAAGLTPDGQPAVPSRALLIDYFGALVTGEAILHGLVRRQRSGRGQRVGASLLGGAMALQAHVLQDLADGQEKGRRQGRPTWSRIDHPLPTSDGALVVCVDGDQELHRLFEACDLASLARAAEDAERALADRIATFTTADAQRRLLAAGIACSAVCTDLATLPHDPRMTGLLEPVGGTAWAPARPWRLAP